MMPIGHGALPDYVSVERKAVKHLRLVINRDASVRLVLPKRASMKSALAFYNDRQAWIDSKRAKVLEQQASAKQIQQIGQVVFHGEHYAVHFNARRDQLDRDSRQLHVRGAESMAAQTRVWRNIAAQDLRQRLQSEAERLQVTINKVSIRDQKSRWGSCSIRGNISLNWRVALMPGWVGDYIIAHEFGHLRHMNHSADFWREVERLCPTYQDAERWLKANGSALMLVQQRS